MKPGFDVAGVRCVREHRHGIRVVIDGWHKPGDDPTYIPIGSVTGDSQVRHLGDYGELCVTEKFATHIGWMGTKAFCEHHFRKATKC